MEYKLVSNNKKDLIIIFQSAGRIPKETFEKILRNDVSKSEVKKLHEKYTWFKFSEYDYVDYLYLEDFYSSSYGWYMFDAGHSIIDELNKELYDFIIKNEYKNVTAYGSSKGGTGALIYGIKNKLINNVFSLVPQIHAVDYIDKKLSDYKKLFFPDGDKKTENYFNSIFFNPDMYNEKNCENTNIFLYTGVGDEQFNETLEFNKYLNNKNINNNIIINSSLKKHNEIVMDNVPFVRSALKLIALRKEMKGPRLYNIDDNILILRDK
ncbi:hypothetical protein [Mammaliicoccus sciuri]|uniref:hypothetical protein n=1 Tax=Mammaliicoccus sciuri TaxID=1296 RepID=UPI001A99CA36|nr:hypothetical protein [Mammaliicoccus sciuri]MBO1218482.1 hypothetical protein [Mammaliicoccus sciuri]MBO1231541.1 hypothetical protein [Mammaliicoccus sciuri]